MKLTHANLAGTWIVSGSEIDHVEPGDEVYQFTPPDRFEMEFRQPDGRLCPSKQQYELTDDGFAFWRDGSTRVSVTAWIEGGFLILRASHGMETWAERLIPEQP